MMSFIFKYSLIVAAAISSIEGFSQNFGLFCSRNHEFIEFQNNHQFYSLIFEGTKISDKKLVFRSGFYCQAHDSLILVPTYDSSYKIANVLTFDNKNDDDSLYTIIFYNMSRFEEQKLKIDLLNDKNKKLEELQMQNSDSIKLVINKFDHLNIVCNNKRDEFEYNLTNHEMMAKRIIIQAIDVEPSLTNTYYLIENSFNSSIILKGPLRKDLKKKNRSKWLNNFRNWPWSWSFKKEHWYDPIERTLYPQVSNKRYFLPPAGADL